MLKLDADEIRVSLALCMTEPEINGETLLPLIDEVVSAIGL